MAWIDYKKAFDSVPHSWILRSLRMMGVNQKVVSALANMMQTWATLLQVNIDGELISTELIAIQKGIYQGDSLYRLFYLSSACHHYLVCLKRSDEDIKSGIQRQKCI